MAGQNDIGDVKGINMRSMELNTAKGAGAHDPMRKGKENPGNTHPGRDGSREAPCAIPMPKKREID